MSLLVTTQVCLPTKQPGKISQALQSSSLCLTEESLFGNYTPRIQLIQREIKKHRKYVHGLKVIIIIMKNYKNFK